MEGIGATAIDSRPTAPPNSMGGSLSTSWSRPSSFCHLCVETPTSSSKRRISATVTRWSAATRLPADCSPNVGTIGSIRNRASHCNRESNSLKVTPDPEADRDRRVALAPRLIRLPIPRAWLHIGDNQQEVRSILCPRRGGHSATDTRENQQFPACHGRQVRTRMNGFTGGPMADSGGWMESHPSSWAASRVCAIFKLAAATSFFSGGILRASVRLSGCGGSQSGGDGCWRTWQWVRRGQSQ